MVVKADRFFSVEELYKSYPQPDSGKIVVLQGCTFSLAQGETLAITGQSGSGKSTLPSLLAGLVAMFSIAGNESLRHENEINMLKVLDAEFMDIRRIAMLEFGLLGLTASLFAFCLSYGFAYAVSYSFFDRLWEGSWQIGLLILPSTTAICVLTALAATRSVVRKKAVALFK